jgi:hypothetical protein
VIDAFRHRLHLSVLKGLQMPHLIVHSLRRRLHNPPSRLKSQINQLGEFLTKHPSPPDSKQHF